MKRRRLTKEEERYLEELFKTEPYLWNKEMKATIAKRLNLEPTKIYKWNWEMVRKLKEKSKSQ